MSLASHLLKHLAITSLCHVPWPLSSVIRDAHGKPCYASASLTPISFNVSHQAGLVPLLASATASLDLGIDIVCVDERAAHTAASIASDGLFAWIDLHADVFAPAELAHLKHDIAHLSLPVPLPPAAHAAAASCERRTDTTSLLPAAAAAAVVDAKLRRFYALWCLREAYVKMTGEALLAPWLRSLEFRAFGVPAAAAAVGEMVWGETRTDFEIYFRGERVRDVAMEIRALGTGYMVASAVRRRDGGGGVPEFPGFEMVGLERVFGAAGGVWEG
jgi:4'-phosphopantetheinyl transferase